jgi:hypothetical protein
VHLRNRSASAFTLLEIALVVGIIGMMLMMIIGYLMAPKHGAMDLNAPPATPIPAPAPAMRRAAPAAPAVPSATPTATPAALQTIDLSSPNTAPLLR